MRIISGEKLEWAQRLRKRGMTYKEIGILLNAGRETVRRALTSGAEEEKRVYDVEYHRNHKGSKSVYHALYRKKHTKRLRDCNTRWRKAHSSSILARNAARRALIVGATMGNLAQIKEIYRRAKEGPKVRCYLCGKLIPKGHRHVDHIVPLSKGGKHQPSNLAIACEKCNLRKGDKILEEIGLLV